MLYKAGVPFCIDWAFCFFAIVTIKAYTSEHFCSQAFGLDQLGFFRRMERARGIWQTDME